MNAKYTRIALDADVERTGTDWDRLKHVADPDIDRSIADDGDSYAVGEGDRLGRVGAGYRYVLYRTGDREWRWRLEDKRGEAIADSHGAFPTRALAERAIASLRKALLGAAA